MITRASGWDAYKRLFPVLYAKPISTFVTDSDLLKTIAILFKLRNSAVAHGRSMNAIGSMDGSGDWRWESANLADVDTFLRDKGLVPTTPAASRPPGLPPECMDWFSNDCADLFWESALRFLSYLDATLPDTEILTFIASQNGRSASLISSFQTA